MKALVTFAGHGEDGLFYGDSEIAGRTCRQFITSSTQNARPSTNRAVGRPVIVGGTAFLAAGAIGSKLTGR